MSKPWSPPKKRSTLLDDIPQAGGFVDPLAVPYKTGAVGESYIFRILTFEPEESSIIPTRKCAVTYTKKDGGPTVYTDIPVPDPGHPHNQTIKDDANVALADRDPSKMYRIPVFYRGKFDKDLDLVGSAVDEVRYLEYTPGIAIQLKKLQDDVEELGFEAIPDYDIRLKIVDNNKIKNYEIKPVRKSKNEDGVLVNDPTWMVPLEEAFSEEWMTFIADSMPAMIEHLRELEESDLDPENVKKRFARYAENVENDNKPAGKGGGPATKAAPSRRPVVSDDDVDTETSNGVEPAEDEEAAASAKPPSKYPPILPKKPR